MILNLLVSIKLRRYRRMGAQIATDCRFTGIPQLGSEPFLVSIGKHVTICGGVQFITHDGGTWVLRGQERYRDIISFGRINVHENCFIGAGAILLPGVDIGPNAVVGAGSVVTKSVPPGTVVAGVPARVLKTTESYGESLLSRTPPYDRQAYRQDKVRELLRLLPRPW